MSNSNTRFQLLGNLTGIGCKMDPVNWEKTKQKKKKIPKFIAILYNANRIKHIDPKNGFPSSLARINARKGKKRKENDQFTPKNRSSDREIDAIILSHCVFPTILRFAYSAENALFPTWLRHSKPNCRYLPRTCCPVEKRDASAWTAATPAIFDKEWRGRCRYGDTRRPRGAARGSLPESASPATSPSFLGITSWNQPFRGGQRPPLPVLSWEKPVEERVFLEGLRQHYSRCEVLLLHSAATVDTSTPSRSVHACLNFVLSLRVIAPLSLSLSRYVTRSSLDPSSLANLR